MAMYDLDDLDTELGLDLPRDEETLDSYDETPLEDTIDGYIVENFRGFDIAVLGHPEGTYPTMSGANPAHSASYSDGDYRVDVTLSPRPMDFDSAFRFEDEDIEIGPEQDSLTPDRYVELEERDQPGRAIRRLMTERDDFRESAIETLGFYVQNHGEDPVGDGRKAAVAASLLGTEPVDEELYGRVEKLAQQYAFDR